jgi:hypothetical protein
MTATDTPGFDGCELLTPINRLLRTFFVVEELCIGALCTMWRHRGLADADVRLTRHT